MKAITGRVLRLLVGLVLYSVGIVLTINANLGLAPWDVFHQGLARVTGLTFGQISILVGFVVLFINYFLGERIGWGTLGNIVLIGWLLDIFMLNHLIPMAQSLISGLAMLVAGMYVIGLATYFYLAAALGSGPRDGLMVALTKKSTKSVRFIRNSIEIIVLVAGYACGGSVGVGTVIIAFTIGYFVQFNFKVFGYDVHQVTHRYIDDDIRRLKELLTPGTSPSP